MRACAVTCRFATRRPQARLLTQAAAASASPAAASSALCSGAQHLQAMSAVQHFTDGSAPVAHYADGMHCSWTIAAPAGGRVQLAFSRFALQPSSGAGGCEHDVVEVYDGSSTAAPQLGRFCGSDIPPVLQSMGATILVVLRTDSSVTAAGFEAHYVVGESDAVTLCWAGCVAASSCSLSTAAACACSAFPKPMLNLGVRRPG